MNKTDLEKFKELYKSLGIELVVSETEDVLVVKIGTDLHRDNDLTVSEKFTGWNGFYSDIQFTKEGKFISQGFWE